MTQHRFRNHQTGEIIWLESPHSGYFRLGRRTVLKEETLKALHYFRDPEQVYSMDDPEVLLFASPGEFKGKFTGSEYRRKRRNNKRSGSNRKPPASANSGGKS